MRRAILLLLALPAFLSACDMGHLGNPVLWPAQAVGTGLENSVYNARRARVKAYVAEHHSALMSEALQGGGAHLTQAYTLARVAPPRHAELTARISQDSALYGSDAEALTVALMVHGG